MLDTPGHTRSHVCLLAHGDAPALFCGDTLFNAGAGNCHNGGDPGLLYETFVNQLAQAARTPRGYFRAMNTWRATWRSRWIASRATPMPRRRWRRRRALKPEDARITTLGEEKRVNAFLRLQNPRDHRAAAREFPEIGEKPDARTVFVKLRELRNSW